MLGNDSVQIRDNEPRVGARSRGYNYATERRERDADRSRFAGAQHRRDLGARHREPDALQSAGWTARNWTARKACGAIR